MPGRNTLASLLIAAAGLITLVGSGGISVDNPLSGSNWSWLQPAPPQVTIEPVRASVQVGESVTFTGQVSSSCGGDVSLQWCRRETWGALCTDLPGATSTTFTLSGANLSDDGAIYELRATCRDPAGLWNSGVAELAVSPMPGIVYLDGEFPEDQWLVTMQPAAPQGDSWGSASRRATGGNPGAYRELSRNAFARSQVFHISQSSTYDPATQGAINAVDFSADGLVLAGEPASFTPAIEQAGRMYVGRDGWHVSGSTWQRGLSVPTLRRSDFWREDYPDSCSDGEACRPDFSAAGAPIRFGYVDRNGHAVTAGIDNWKVTVWRR